jgi:hypothetical protein
MLWISKIKNPRKSEDFYMRIYKATLIPGPIVLAKETFLI